MKSLEDLNKLKRSVYLSKEADQILMDLYIAQRVHNRYLSISQVMEKAIVEYAKIVKDEK